jgi:DNA-binding response OmpR family regulator
MGKQTMKILVVDDEQDIRNILCRHLKLDGYECAAAQNGEEALKTLQTDDYDLLITDIMMPGMSGMDLLNIVKRLFPDVAVIMVTAVDDRETGILAVELGAFGYVIKPFSHNDISINVANALERRREQLLTKKNNGKSLSSDLVDSNKIRKIQSISDEELEQCVKCGIDDIQIKEESQMTEDTLKTRLNKLIESGKLTREEVDNRPTLTVGTVAVDIPTKELSKSNKDRPVISASDALNCIRAGMDDLDLMFRYGITAKGLRSLFKKLIESGKLTADELYTYTINHVNSAVTEIVRELPKYYLAMAAIVYEPSQPEIHGSLSYITAKGLGVTGIASQVGEHKTLVIPPIKALKSGNIWFEATCIWSNGKKGNGNSVAGFQIAKIEDDSLEALRELIRFVSLAK